MTFEELQVYEGLTDEIKELRKVLTVYASAQYAEFRCLNADSRPSIIRRHMRDGLAVIDELIQNLPQKKSTIKDTRVVENDGTHPAEIANNVISTVRDIMYDYPEAQLADMQALIDEDGRLAVMFERFETAAEVAEGEKRRMELSEEFDASGMWKEWKDLD